jgi:predicted adenine nucleotide alpha hydrolase (AANH) superfamily ATPase
MNRENYDSLMQKVVSKLKNSTDKKKLLMHACCAPCSSSCIERLKYAFDITIYFYNPNMDSIEEYFRRAEEQRKLCEKMGVDCVVVDYNPQEFYNNVIGLENEREGGKRCEKCFLLRLSKTGEYAKEFGYDYFTTTLTVSPLKNAELLNKIGKAVSERVGVEFLPSDFKKRNGYLRSIELSKEFSLYRQNYCGCEFSKNLLPTE